MHGTVTVYFETGFNSGNIPVFKSVLNQATSRTYNDSYFIREDLEKPFIVIRDSYDNLRAIDYLKINTVECGEVYFFAVPRANAQRTTTVFLKLDALTTLGGAGALDYSGGWMARGHIPKTEDTLFGNIAAEDFTPSKPLVTTNSGYVRPSGGIGTDINPVISTINLTILAGQPDATADVISGIVAGTTDPVMYLPKLTSPNTNIRFYRMGMDVDTDVSYVFNHLAVYEGTGSTTKAGLQKLFSFGQLDIQGAYTVPGKWVRGINSPGGSTLPDGVYGSLYGVREEKQSAVTFEISGYTPKNKKTLALFRSVTLVNTGSGGMNTQDIFNLFRQGETAVKVLLWSDLTATGKPFGRFAIIATDPYIYGDVVEGLQWNSQALSFSGAPGSLFNSIDSSLQLASIARAEQRSSFGLQQARIAKDIQTERGMINTGIGAAGAVIGGALSLNPLNTVGGIINAGQQIMNEDYNNRERELAMRGAEADAAFTAADLAQQRNENAIGLLKANNVIAPTNLFMPQPSLSLYGIDDFAVYETRMQQEDMEALDKYFQRFGYAGLHKPLTAACFTSRDYYCYVQAFDVNIKSTYGKRIREAAIAQLNGGVRCWKVLPDASYYDLN